MRSIRSKIILMIALVSIVVAAAVGFILYLGGQQEIMSIAEDQLTKLAERGAQAIFAGNEYYLSNLESMAQNSILTDNGPKEKLVAYLDEQAKRLGFQTLGIVQPDGVGIVNDGSTLSVADREWFQSAIAGNRTISDVLISRVNNLPIINYVVPVYRNDKIVAVLRGACDADILTKESSPFAFGENGYAYIMNEKGVLIAHPNYDYVLNGYSVIEDAKTNKDYRGLADIMENQMMRGESGVERYYFDGAERIMSFAPIPGTGWSLASAWTPGPSPA